MRFGGKVDFICLLLVLLLFNLQVIHLQRYIHEGIVQSGSEFSLAGATDFVVVNLDIGGKLSGFQTATVTKAQVSKSCAFKQIKYKKRYHFHT